jgi:hypothetical protein
VEAESDAGVVAMQPDSEAEGPVAEIQVAASFAWAWVLDLAVEAQFQATRTCSVRSKVVSATALAKRRVSFVATFVFVLQELAPWGVQELPPQEKAN